MRAGAGRAAVLTGLLALAACAHYSPAPTRPEVFPAALKARRLEAPASRIWSGADLLAASLAGNPQIAEAAARYRTAVAAAKTARVPPSATLTLTAEYSKAAGGDSPWLYGVGSDIPLAFGARRSGRWGAADLAALQALYDYGEAVWSVRTSLARAHAERLSTEAELGPADRLVTIRQARAERLDRRVRLGEDDRPRALLAQTDLAAARRRVGDVRARRDQANVALAKALGVSVQTARDIPLAPMAAAPDVSDWAGRRVEAALGRRDVLRAIVDYDLAESALRLEVARQYPEIHIGPGYVWERGVSKLPFNLSLVLPPSDLNRAAIAQAEAKRAEAGRSVEAVQASVLADVDQSAVALAAARSAEDITLTRDLPVAQRLAVQAARSLKAGETDRVDDLAAQAVLLETELAALDARRASAGAVIDLEDALRAPFDPAQMLILQTATKSLGGGS